MPNTLDNTCMPAAARGKWLFDKTKSRLMPSVSLQQTSPGKQMLQLPCPPRKGWLYSGRFFGICQ